MKCLDPPVPHVIPGCSWLPRTYPVLYRSVPQLVILRLEGKVKLWLRNVMVHTVFQYQSSVSLTLTIGKLKQPSMKSQLFTHFEILVRISTVL